MVQRLCFAKRTAPQQTFWLHRHQFCNAFHYGDLARRGTQWGCDTSHSVHSSYAFRSHISGLFIPAGFEADIPRTVALVGLETGNDTFFLVESPNDGTLAARGGP
jgi:hypothetical protein